MLCNFWKLSCDICKQPNPASGEKKQTQKYNKYYVLSVVIQYKIQHADGKIKTKNDIYIQNRTIDRYIIFIFHNIYIPNFKAYKKTESFLSNLLIISLFTYSLLVL